MVRGREIKTGVQKLDSLIPGYVQGTLNIIGGRPSAGKTAFALETAAAMASNKNIPVLYFTVKQSAAPMKERIQDNAQIFFDEESKSIEDIADKTRKMIEDKNIGFVVVDYLQLVSYEEHKDNESERVIRALRELAEENNIPIVLLAMLNRDVEKRDEKRPYITDFENYECVTANSDKVFMIQDDNGQKTYLNF